MSNDALSNEQLNYKVAELVMGWEQVVEGRGLWKDRVGHTLCTEGTPGVSIMVSHWNPTTDLNACFEAQALCVARVGWSAYEYALLDSETDAEAALERFATATAHQRCLAMLACMESSFRDGGNEQ